MSRGTMSRGTSRSLFFVLLVIVTCGFLGSAAFSQRGNPSYQTGASDNDVRDSLHQFSEIYDLVEQNYAEPVNPDKFSRDLAEKINLLMADPAMCKRFGEAGRKRAIEKFSWATIAAETKKMYESLL